MTDDSSSPSPWNVRHAAWLTLGFSGILLFVALVWGVDDVFVWTAAVLVLLASVGQFIVMQRWKRQLLERLDEP